MFEKYFSPKKSPRGGKAIFMCQLEIRVIASDIGKNKLIFSLIFFDNFQRNSGYSGLSICNLDARRGMEFELSTI